MSYNGSGTFVINTAGQPVVSGTVISSTAFNALTADLATGLSTAITKDGQTTPTANIPMGNNKITGLAVGTAATDAANLSQVQSTTAKLITASGTDTVTGTLSPTLTAYAAGQMFYWVAAGTNTGAVTLNIDSLGAKAVTRDGSTALAAGDIRSGEVVVVVYDGTRFQVVSQINSSGDATFANVSITSALNVGGVATFTGNPVLSGGTANGVLYLNGSKVATSGSALTFDGTNFATTGTSSAAKLIPTGGTASGNGIYLPAANSIGITTSSTNAIRINSSQQTGFGNTAPAYRVHATQTSDGAATTVACLENGGTLASTEARMLFVQGGNTTRGAYVGGVNESASGQPTSMVFGTSAAFATPTERMRLDSSGNLGIGTSSPSNRLDVFASADWQGRVVGNAGFNGGLIVEGNATGTRAQINLKTNNGTAREYYLRNVGGTFSLLDNTAGTIPFTVEAATPSNTIYANASGNLGIGITSPAEQLSIYQAAASASLGVSLQAAASTFGKFRIQNDAFGSNWAITNNFETYNAVVDKAAYYTQEIAFNGSSTNGIVFSTGASAGAAPTERMRVTSAGELLVGKTTTTANGGVVQVSNGVTFPATQVACSDANTLDDYEEGTWTPTAAGQTTPGTTTYTTQTGVYTKIGRQVTASFDLNVSNMTGTGTLLIDGLPFTSSSSNLSVGAVVIRDYDWTAGTSVSVFLGNSRTYMNIYISADNAAWEVGAVDASFRVIGTISYIV